MKISDFKIRNHDKLDQILVRLCDMVVEGQKKDPELYGVVAAAVLDPNNNCVAALNYRRGRKDVHGERAAIDAYRERFGEIPEGSIILTTCSPCTEPMPDRAGDSCEDLISSTPVHKVYAGYRDPSQHTLGGNKTYHLQITRNKKIQALCKAFADTWLKDDLDEGAAEHVRMVMSSAADLMKQHGFRAVGQLSPEDLEQIAQRADATLHDVCIILNIDHVDEKLDELALRTTLPVTQEPSRDGYWLYRMKTESGEYQLHFYIENKDENYEGDPDYDGPTGYALRVFFLGKTPEGRWIQFNTNVGEKEVLKIFATIAQLASKIVKENPTVDEIVISGADQQRGRIYTRLMQQNASQLLPGWIPGGDGLVKQGNKLNELSFLGSPCTKDCSGHRAGYAWSQSKGGRVAQSPFSPSFNKGSQLHVDGK
jgi:pyrimidine deaminase RibD-like protein